MQELERLLNASVDGELSDEDEAALQTLLREDPAARRDYLQFMQLHAELHWDHGASVAMLVSPEDQATDRGRSGRRAAMSVRGWVLLTITMATLATGWMLAAAFFTLENASDRDTQPAPAIASIQMTQGTVSFRTVAGESRRLSGRGQTLSAGTLVLEVAELAIEAVERIK